MSLHFFRCNKCGKLVFIHENGYQGTCCETEMKSILPNTTDGAREKHVPVYYQAGNKLAVRVGDKEHPMGPDHYIQWIWVETTKGVHAMELHPGDKPLAIMYLLPSEEVKDVYAFCNLHGLWVQHKGGQMV